MNTKLLVSALVISTLTGCATAPATPPEPLISVQLRGTAVEVQQFIEDRFRKNPTSGLRVENATDRAITFKGDCMNTAGMNAFKCTAIMMAVGNSRWDGPYLILTFRTAEVRGVVNLTLNSEWCATNAFGKSNCMPGGSNAEMNDVLRKVEQAYKTEVRAL
jgi:hypothetical protein